MLVKRKRSAGVERVVGIEVCFESLEHFELLASDRAFEEGRKKFADAVMVRKRGTRLHDCFQNGAVILSESVEIGGLDDEDEV